MTKQVIRIAALAALAGYAGVLAYLSLRPSGPETGIEGADKVYHFIAYAGLMGLAVLAFRKARLAWLFLACCAYGLSMEIAQGALTAVREPSWQDALANSLGAGAVAIGAALIWPRRVG